MNSSHKSQCLESHIFLKVDSIYEKPLEPKCQLQSIFLIPSKGTYLLIKINKCRSCGLIYSCFADFSQIISKVQKSEMK